jgi:hypothetical protein
MGSTPPYGYPTPRIPPSLLSECQFWGDNPLCYAKKFLGKKMTFFGVFMIMNLQENIQRIREIMEVQPLNENVSKFRGKFGDFINRIFKNKKNQGNDAQEIVNVGNKYDQKYGKSEGGIVESFTIVEDSVKTGLGYLSLLDIIIFTEEVKDATKLSLTYYLTYFVNDESSKEKYNYEYYKGVYYTNRVLTDEFSFVNENGNSVCNTDTLDGQKGGCTLSSEVKQNILKRYEKDPDYQNLTRFLDRISR